MEKIWLALWTFAIEFLPPQLSDLNATAVLDQSVSVIPMGLEELGGPDDDLFESDAGACLDGLDMDVDARAQTKDQSREAAIQYQITTSEEHFAWGRNGGHNGLATAPTVTGIDDEDARKSGQKSAIGSRQCSGVSGGWILWGSVFLFPGR
jgi:hypothetical protein